VFRVNEMIVQNLSLELTRKCNLNCRHCMRGESQNLTMDDEVIERIFKDINGVYSLQFGGGETSLVVDRLKKVVETIKKNNTTIRSSLVFTNALNISDEYIETLKELKAHIEQTNRRDWENHSFDDDFDYEYKGLATRMSEKYPLIIVVSLDKYHLESIDNLSSREVVKNNIDKLIKEFPVEIDKICNFLIYNEGKGKNLQGAYKTKVPLQQYNKVNV